MSSVFIIEGLITFVLVIPAWWLSMCNSQVASLIAHVNFCDCLSPRFPDRQKIRPAVQAVRRQGEMAASAVPKPRHDFGQCSLLVGSNLESCFGLEGVRLCYTVPLHSGTIRKP